MEPNNNEMLNLNNTEMQNFMQEENNVVQNESFNNNVQNSKNNLKVVLIAVVALIVIIFGVVFASSMFKSDEEKFYDLLLKKQAVGDLIKEPKDGQVDTLIEVDMADFIEQVMYEDINGELKVGYKISNVQKKDDFSGEVGVLLNDEEIIAIEYAKTGDLFAGRVKDMTEDFIGFENKDLQDMFEKFDIPDADELPDRILMPEDFEKVVKMKKSDANKMINKYIKVLAKNSKDAVEVENNVELKIGKEKFKTQKYTLELTEKDTFEMTKAVLETLKEDEKNIELILNDFKAVLELMEENNYPVEDMYYMTADDIPDADEVMEMIEDTYKELLEDTKDYKFDDEEIIVKISVYEFKGKTIATAMEVDDEKIIFKSLIDKDMYIGVIVEEGDEELAEIALKGTMDKDELDAEFVMEAEGIKVELFTIEQSSTNSTKNLKKLDDKNTLILNDADEEDLEEYAEEFVENAEEWAEEMEEMFEDTEAFGDLVGGTSTSNTVSHAQFSGFVQEFGDYAMNFKFGPVIDLREKFAIEGTVVTNAHLYYMAATGAEYENGILVPEGIEFVTKLNTLSDPNLYGVQIWGNGDIACWEIKDSQIAGYEDGQMFYGNNLGTEKHFVTQDGTVFTLPGFPRTVDDEYRMYITDSTYYITDKNHFDIIDSNDGMKVEEKNANVLGM